MATGKLRNLFEDSEHYKKAFLCYDKTGDRVGIMERWCQSVFQKDIVPKLNVNIPEGEELCTLGVGSGSGEMESYMLEQLLQKFQRISNHVVEPSAELSTKYKAYVSANSAQLQGIDYHWHQQLFQDFKEQRDKDGNKTKFHFISAIRSLYFFTDPGKWLDYLYGLLENGGMLMVILVTDTSSWARLWATFPGMSNVGKSCTSAHVNSHFEKRGIQHYNFTVEVKYDMAQILDPEPSQEADLLIDFLSHTVNFRKDVDPEIRDKFMKFMQGELKKDGDRLIWNNEGEVTIVQK